MYSYLKRYSVFFITFSYLTISLIFIAPYYEISSYLSTSYLVNYNYGFTSRALVGTIYNLFFLDYTQRKLFLFVYISSILMIILLSMVLQKLYFYFRELNKDVYYYYLFFIMLVFSPTSVKYLFYVDNFGRLDLYMYIFFFTSILIVLNHKGYLLLPIVLFLGLASHQAFFFMFIPSIIIFLLLEVLSKRSFYSKLIFIVSIIISVGFFLYFQFYKSAFIFTNLDEAIIALSPNTDVYVHRQMLELEYFVPFSYHMENIYLPFLKEIFYPGLIFLFIYSPILYIFYSIIKNQNKILITLFILSMCSFIPMFFLTIDWGRWFAAIIVVISIQLLFFEIYSEKSKTILEIFKLEDKRIRLSSIIIIVYILSIGYIQTFGLSSALNIFKMIRAFLKI